MDILNLHCQSRVGVHRYFGILMRRPWTNSNKYSYCEHLQQYGFLSSSHLVPFLDALCDTWTEQRSLTVLGKLEKFFNLFFSPKLPLSRHLHSAGWNILEMSRQVVILIWGDLAGGRGGRTRWKVSIPFCCFPNSSSVHCWLHCFVN